MDAITYGSIVEARLKVRLSRCTTEWTDERVARLKELHAAGVTYEAIGREFGVTRSAISGKVRRLGMGVPMVKHFGPKPKRVQKPGWMRLKKPEKAPPPAMQRFLDKFPMPEVPIDLGLRTELSCDVVGLTKHNCHWPIGTPSTEDFFFCGQKAVDGRPYCGAHCRIAYTPTKSPRPTFRNKSGTRFVGRV